MRKYVFMMMCAIFLSACSSSGETSKFDTTMIVTTKVTEKTEERVEGKAIYYITILAKIKGREERITLEVADENVWNLIEEEAFYRISFDTKEGTGYGDNSPLKSIDSITVDEERFMQSG